MKINNYSFDEIYKYYIELLNVLESDINISWRKTILEKYMRILKGELSLKDEGQLLDLIQIFRRLQNIIVFYQEIKTTQPKVRTLIKKSIQNKLEEINVNNDQSNDFLFEIESIVRFLKIGKNVSIETDSDIIIDNEVAIECKNLHSESKCKKNINKAEQQILQRITNKQANEGVIFLNLYSLIDKKPIINYLRKIFKCKYEKCKEEYINKIPIADIQSKVTKNADFQYIMSEYVKNYLDSYFFNIFNGMILNEKIIGVFYQIELSLNLLEDSDSEMFPMVFRSASYHINKKYSGERKEENIKTFFSSLAVGV